MHQFPFPAPPGSSELPQWTGAGFRLGDRLVPLLEYSDNGEGWSDDLTELHEEAAGDSHAVDTASRNDALAQLEARFDKRPFTVLEVGCSSGFMLKALRRRFPQATLIGSDVVRGPLAALAREEPSIPLLRFDLLKCPLPSESCDAVVTLNVLEHIADDAAALGQIHRILKPGGVVVIEVPAGPRLFDAYDQALLHFRRYRLSELTEKLENAGFSVERRSHLGFFLYPAFAAVKLRNQLTHQQPDLVELVKTQASRTSKSRLISLAMQLEAALGKVVSYPIGIRCLAVARKR